MSGGTGAGADPAPGGGAGPETEDLALAAAIASLPLMTPQRLRQLLNGRGAADAWARVQDDPSWAAGLLNEMSSFQNGVMLRSDPRRGRPLTVGEIAGTWQQHARRLRVDALWASLVGRGIQVLRVGDDRYPRRLREDAEAPELLFARGEVGVVEGPAVAVVGTRRATHYGMEMAAEIAGDLARAGVCIVSGLAAGIDAAAHEGALGALLSPRAADSTGTGAGGGAGTGGGRDGGRPLGVLGGGVDVYYPSRNRRLIDRVREAGCLISEAPPGEAPEPWRFPLRNRIIAALAHVVVVVESTLSGGSMHTVEAALSRGREVFAVPGSVRSPASEGTNELLSAGAHVARDAADVLVALEAACTADGIPVPLSQPQGRRQGSGSAARPDRQTVRRLLQQCSEEERRVHSALDDHAITVDAVCERLGLGLGTVVVALDRLMELGLAAPAEGGWRRL
jgi:predicted Rossmann fold nucleotide-binding protein DprA/Smf involved in DNA uptake